MVETKRSTPPPGWDDVKVFEDHPELHHYTTRGGLTGIVSTNTLWGTYFRDLNDASELMVIRQPLIAELTASFRNVIQKQRRRRHRIDRAVSKAGGVNRAADDLAKKMIGLLYASTFTVEEGLEGVKDLNNQAYITSFCTHSGQTYEQDNGLLSQWRAYGGEGGFAIVFDGWGLLDFLDRENKAHAYMKMSINEAIYLYPPTPVSAAFPKLREACDTFMVRLLEGMEQASAPTDIITDFIHAALSCKHHAFHEEQEVRLAVQPATEGWRTVVGEERKVVVPPAKQPRDVGGLNRVVLFDGLGLKLPITRVIVGPSSAQDANAEYARNLLGSDVPVVLSQTPYIDRASARGAGGQP
jgi:hypothetical protein